jgi:isopenicillin N synthase-like dioxygenase
MHTDNVPIIDITKLEQARTLDSLDLACREWGFFQVTGHGIEDSVITELFAVSRAFFSQPLAVKREVLRTAENPWGFFDQELTKNTRDWKQIYDFGPTDDAAIRPQWPPSLPRFAPAVRRFYDSCERLAHRLLAAISVNLGMPADYLGRGFNEAHTSFLRLNFYPKCPEAAAHGAHSNSGRAQLGVNAHTDSGALTLLLQDQQPGLEVFRSGRWHLVEPRRDALVINIGDIVQVWSNDRYRAALHRVITNPQADRYSVPFFFNPAYSINYQPLPTTIDTANPAHYRPINWREFRSLRAAGDYADYGEEVQIAHYQL